MRTPVLLPITLFLLFVSTSLSAQTCQAAFSFGETGLTIAFADESTSAAGDPIASWLWDFDDGATSTLQNPTHTFPEPDKYDVCLTVTTQSGCASQLCVRIETCILDVSVAVGDCSANGEIPVTVTVNDLFDNAKDINISLDGQLLPGSPFGIDVNQPVTASASAPGDGLSHAISVQSEDIGTCSSTYTFTTPDCSSDCFLSGMSVNIADGNTQVIQVGDNFFAPQNATITVGDVVEFQWVGDGHSTTSDATAGPDSWNSGIIGFGAVYTVNITNPGVHRYYCIPHGGPNGQGMSGMIVANCPPSGQFSLLVSFNAATADPAGYNILLDGTPVPGGPFAYSGTGPQSNTLSIAGDGASHSVEIQDVADPSCSISRTFPAPDCGAAPACSVSLSASQAGGCSPANEVPVELSVSAVNGGPSGFNVYVDGNLVPNGPFDYNLSGPASATINVTGDGLSHAIEVRDIDDPTCNSSITLVTQNCDISCSFTNLNVATGSSLIHTVLVEDFAFNPSNIAITAGDVVEWEWVGSVAHTATSDATSGPDSWDSGLLSQGATFRSPVLSAGIHPYYCVPHGAPGGVGMSGTVTVQANCTDGMVSAAVSFAEQGGGFNGYEVLVDGNLAGTFAYDASGANTAPVSLPGDGQPHAIAVRDVDDPACQAATTVTTPDCNASACQLSLSAQEAGGCTGANEVAAELTVGDVGGGASGFEVLVDGAAAGTYAYSGTGTTVVTVNIAGDGQPHDIEVRDINDAACTATATLTTTDCASGCAITGLRLETAGAGNPITHVVEVRDFEFVPAQLEVSVGDIVRFEWTGVIAHTTTSDATTGPDSWDSGLLGQGEVFEVTITSQGQHPYYCIPHGGPGGVGMSGMIIASPPCDGGNISLSVSFDAVGGGASGFNLLLDGELYPGSPYGYAPSPSNTIVISIPGDGQQHAVKVEDAASPDCSAEAAVTAPDCQPDQPCALMLHGAVAGDCNENDEVPVELEIISEGVGDNGFIVKVDGSLYQPLPFPYNPSGNTTITLQLTGTGEERLVEVQDVDSTACSATVAVNTPLCGPVCEIQGLSVSSGQPGKHIVEVRDFEFFPVDIEVIVGDTVEFQWTGSVLHTSTSDAASGPNSWNSGLLGLGARYEVVITEAGLHPYYCIPHGGPGGIGMAGVIEALEPCANGTALVTVGFSTTNGSSNGYNIFLDGEYLAGPVIYANEAGYNSTLASIPGDSAQHILTVQDLDVSFCAASTTFVAPECEILCEVTNLNAATGNDVAHVVYVEDFQFTPAELDVRVGERVRFLWAGQIPHTATSDAISGPDSWNSGLLGQGSSYEVVISTPGVHPYYCIPHGGPGGIGMSGTIRAAPVCGNDSIYAAVSFGISSGSSLGYNIFVDGQGVPGNPHPYDDPMGFNQQFIRLPGDGLTHLVTVQDQETGFCAATAQITVPNCSAGCAIGAFAVSFPEPGRHQVEVRDFEFAPRELTVTAGDTIEFFWTGAIPHTTTSDATTGTDSWDSGLLSQGATFELIIQESGQHPYYCIPHGGPGGIGMAGLITALPACQGDSVLASLSFSSFGGGGGYSLLLDGSEIGQYAYQPGGVNVQDVLLLGDGQNHELAIRDLDDPECGGALSVDVPLCTEACLLQATVAQSGACDENMEVPFEVAVSGHNEGSEGFQVFIDGALYPGGPYAYAPAGTTVIAISLEGDGMPHQLVIEDVSTPGCSQAFGLVLPNCLEPCAGFTPAFSVTFDTQDSLLAQFTDETAGNVHHWLWGFGDGATSNVQNPFHTYAQPGIYTVCLLAQDTILGCNQAVCRDLGIGVTGTAERPESLPLRVFPNPARQNASRWMVQGIVPSDHAQLIHYVAYGLRGERVAEGWIEGGKVMEIPLDRLIPTGMYFLELRSPFRVYTGSVVVQ
ncbi:MAG: PKD domain-containing protein [Phaeodactylibacter sp.]|nr:PKD domain-containing protein [Phaeodactylibacter sp.]